MNRDRTYTVRIVVTLCICCLPAAEAGGQGTDYSWWNRIHRWDGHTPWSDYLIVSPSFMGPNALPVPEIKKGAPDAGGSFELGMEGHLGRGDQTANFHAEFKVPLFTERAVLVLSCVPVEFYRTDTVTRDLRRSREYDGRGTALGDLYLSTRIHLVREREKIPDVMLTVNLKTASGTRFEAARHTDAPGYFFDASVGKTLYRGAGSLGCLRAYGLLGFYVYQTNLENHMQNDALQYGAGIDMEFGRFRLEQQLGGYSGYLDIGDRPLVYRMNLACNLAGPAGFEVRFQQGLRDFPYSSLRLGVVRRFGER